MSCRSRESDDAETDGGGDGQQEGGDEGGGDGDLRGEPGAPDGGDLPDAQRAGGGVDQQGGQRGHGDGPDDAGEQRQDQEHPQTGEDRRPPGTGAGGPVEGGLADRTADGLALEEPRALTLPTPWAMKSALASERVPSSLGADSATPTPCTSTIAVTANAPASSDHENDDSSGHAGSGMPRGMSPWSSTRATSAPDRITAIVGIARATTALKAAMRVRDEQDDDGERGDADEDRRPIDAARMDQHIPRLLHGDRSVGLGTGEVGDLPGDDVDRHAAEEADHHGVADEPGEPTHADQPGGDHRRPGHEGEEEQGCRPLLRAQVLHRRSSGERGGARGGDHHQLRAGAEPAGDRPAEAGIQAVDRVDAGEHARRHPVGDTADGDRQAGHRVGLQGPPPRRHRPEPATDTSNRVALHHHPRLTTNGPTDTNPG